MKRVLALLTLTLILTSVVSAEMLLKQQPKELYNLGEVVKIPIKITTNIGIDEFFSLKLICNGLETEVHKQYIYLTPAEEQDISIAIPLIASFIGRATGSCVARAEIGIDYLVTEEFTISNIITNTIEQFPKQVDPEESFIVEGTAIKENGKNVDGYISFTLGMDSLENSIQISDTVKNGYFYLNTSLPKDTPTGEYPIRLEVFEKDKYGNKSNIGITDLTLTINQVPTSLELILEEQKINPGEIVMIKPVLHDQTGITIESTAKLSIRNEKDKLIDTLEIPTNEFYELPIEEGYPPSNWSLSLITKDFEVDEVFYVKEYEKADIEILNNTVIITNIGNVDYNDTAIVKLGNETFNINAFVPLNKIKKYSLTAPDGEYEVEVISEDGENKIAKTVMLTGNAISVNELNDGLLSKVKTSMVWFFILAVLGFMAMIVYRKGYKKAFFGYITKRKKHKKVGKGKHTNAGDLVISKYPAILSLSIKGETQNTSLVCIKIKNKKKVEKNDIAKQTLQETVEIAEQYKAHTYQNGDYIMFMLAPIKTKTFANQKPAVILAQSIESLLKSYNKLAKEKIDYGISINFGTIVGKSEKDSLKFMSMGTLLTKAKKVSAVSEGEILLTDKIRDKLMSHVKTEKKEKNGIKAYTIKQVVKKSAENKRFIQNFIKKLEKENKEKAKQK